MKTEYLLPSQIADMLYCDRPTASVIIKNMEKINGLLKRKILKTESNILLRLQKSEHKNLKR